MLGTLAGDRREEHHECCTMRPGSLSVLGEMDGNFVVNALERDDFE